MNATPASPRRRVAIVGGGLSGLAAAWRLHETQADSIDVTLLEAREQLGGILRTVRRGEYLVELAADMFTTKDPWAIELCRRLGVEEELVSANESGRRVFIVHRGQLVQAPPGFVLLRPTKLWSVLTTPLLSWKGKLRLMMEPLIRARREESDESLQDFTVRRLGREVFERIVQPLVGGIYTADPAKLSMAAALPAFREMEHKYGSLARAPRGRGESQASGARYGAFVAPRAGMAELAQFIAARLPSDSIRTGAPLKTIRREQESWKLEFADRPAESYDGLILACGAPATARLMQHALPDLAGELHGIPHASAALVIMGVPRAAIGRPVDGFGVVAPLVENRKLLAISFASHKFPGRAPDDSVLIRAFVGGACQGELLENSDSQLIDIVRKELRELIDLCGREDFVEVARWNEAMPQYHLGHLERVARIERAVEKAPALEIAGNYLRGVGVPFCIRGGERAADRLAARFAPESNAPTG